MDILRGTLSRERTKQGVRSFFGCRARPEVALGTLAGPLPIAVAYPLIPVAVRVSYFSVADNNARLHAAREQARAIITSPRPAPTRTSPDSLARSR